MAGAVPLTGIGVGYMVSEDEPPVFVRAFLGRYQVCVAKDGYAEIAAECRDEGAARVLARYYGRA